MYEAEKLRLEQIEAFLKASQNPVRRRNPRADLSLDRTGSVSAAVLEAKPSGAGIAAALPGEDDRPEPGAGDAADRVAMGKAALQPAPYWRHRFPQRYTRADIELLAAVDETHAFSKVLQFRWRRDPAPVATRTEQWRA